MAAIFFSILYAALPVSAVFATKSEAVVGPALIASCVIEAGGWYKRAIRKQRLRLLRIVALDGKRRMVSAVHGPIKRQQKTWIAGVGDFRMVYY